MPKRRPWQPIVLWDVAFIPLTRGKWALVDTNDLPLVVGRVWGAVDNGGKGYDDLFYATASRRLDPAKYSRYGVDKMHRVIMGLDFGDPRQVDHIDHNGLNNRRSNLRIATCTQNQANKRIQNTGTGTSRYKGVSWRSRRRKWAAQIMVDGRNREIGCFAIEEDAAAAYDAAAREAWGPYAYQNLEGP